MRLGKDRVRLCPSSRREDNGQHLISVRCYNSQTKTQKTLIGEGHVDFEERELGGYVWRKLKSPKVNLSNAKTNIHIFIIKNKAVGTD